MKPFHTYPFQPWFARTDKAQFHSNSISDLAFLQPQWKGIFGIQEGLRKLLLEFRNKKKSKTGPQKEDAEKRIDPLLELNSKVLVYPLRPDTSEKPYKGGLRNLSKNGVCIECSKPFSETQLVLLDFQLPGKKKIQIPVRVVWSKNNRIGFELLNPEGIEEILKDTRPA
jgi:PilZ domain